MKQLTQALVIGSSGAMGASLVRLLAASGQYDQIHAVSRQLPLEPVDGVKYQVLPSHSEPKIAEYCQLLAQSGKHFSLIVCCIGSLHGLTSSGKALRPEKRFADIHGQQLKHYFQVNTVIPALWLKHAESLCSSSQAATLVFLSARVGSISDNHLGGWYGYRASKAALNMLLQTAQIEFNRRAQNVTVVAYHPGTVDSALSKPFQANVAAEKLFSADFSCQQLLTHLASLSRTDKAQFIDWQGRQIDW